MPTGPKDREDKRQGQEAAVVQAALEALRSCAASLSWPHFCQLLGR